MDDMTYCEDRGTTISASVSYAFCQSEYPVLNKQNSAELISAHIPSHSIQNQSGHSCVYLGLTHFGTTTSKVMRYSESSTKSSFLTMSARLLVNRLPLLAHNSITTTQTHMRVLLLIKAFWSQSIQTRSR